jgi:hypothetical protein
VEHGNGKLQPLLKGPRRNNRIERKESGGG